MPEARVKEAFLSLWCRLNSEYIESLAAGLTDLIPLESDGVNIAQG